MIKTGLLATALTLVLCSWAHAGVIAQLTNPTETGSPGDSLAFEVTLTNTSLSDQVWLNGSGSTASSPFLSIDTSPFDANAPLFLDPQTSSGLFELFKVTIAPTTPPGGYIGSFISIEGGPDGGAGTDFTDLVDISFDVDVQPSATPVPESGTLSTVALAAALALMAGCKVSRQRNRV